MTAFKHPGEPQSAIIIVGAILQREAEDDGHA